MCFSKCLDFRVIFINRDHFLVWSTLETRSREASHDISMALLYFLVTTGCFPLPLSRILLLVLISEMLASLRQNRAERVAPLDFSHRLVGELREDHRRPVPRGLAEGSPVPVAV